MEREADTATEILDLGEATAETKGAWGLLSDEVLMHTMAGLADD